MSGHVDGPQVFHLIIWDYVVFCGMLAASIGIGIYYACSGGKQKTTSEYLMGDRKMSIWPVSFSLVATYFSAISMMGAPAEIYMYGIIYWFIAIAEFFSAVVTANLFVPVFYKLQLTSIYEYVELRFNKTIQVYCTVIYFLSVLMYLGFVVYAPSLALSQVTGFHMWHCALAVTIICTCYTAVGGIKAVMWTDTLQFMFMFCSMMIAIIRGCSVLGGLDLIWQESETARRLEVFEGDIGTYSLASVLIGGSVMTLAWKSTEQAIVQRYLSTKTLSEAKTTVYLYWAGMALFLTLYCLAGLIISAAYWKCDPVSNKQTDSPDQIFPFFVMEIFSNSYPGLSGVFVAGLTSCAISSLSSIIASLATVTLKQLVQPLWKNHLSERMYTLIAKLLVVLYGGIALILVAIAERMGTVLEAVNSIGSAASGPHFGIFLLGMFCPWATSLGAGIGSLSGLAVSLWIVISVQNQNIEHIRAPVSTCGCNFTQSGSYPTLWERPSVWKNTSWIQSDCFNVSSSDQDSNADVSSFYSLNYMWYCLISSSVTVFVGLVVSLITGRQNVKQLDRRLVSNVAWKLYDILHKTERLEDKNLTDLFLQPEIKKYQIK